MILPKQRDLRFITIRRGGTLTDSDHHLLASWAAACAEHVLHLFTLMINNLAAYPSVEKLLQYYKSKQRAISGSLAI